MIVNLQNVQNYVSTQQVVTAMTPDPKCDQNQVDIFLSNVD